MMRLADYFRSRAVTLVPFCSETTPLHFSDSRIEHLATRRGAGLFDFSFMGCFEAQGPKALAFLNFLQTRNLASLATGRACYTLLCDETGSVINDATVWRLGADHYWLFTGRRDDWRHVSQVAEKYDVALADLSGLHAVIALQGPRSRAILQRCLSRSAPEPYFNFARRELCGSAVWVGRLGYTGEWGYELLVPSDAAVAVWERLLAEGKGEGLIECGFEAANSLRIESGYILFAQELKTPVTPYELGMGRWVSLPRAPFIGSSALEAMRYRPPARALVGLVLEERLSGAAHFSQAQITSQCHSPILGKTLALGFVQPKSGYPGSLVRAEDGRTARVARLPFYDPLRLRVRSAHITSKRVP
jgi:glycine cleavage system T protein (aminomethyltransferase)